MTVREATELDKAIARAESNGIQVIARGRMKSDNSKFFLTNSHSTDGVHVVRLQGARLLCDCKSRVICAHRGATHVYLVNEAARKQRDAEAVVRELEHEANERQASAQPAGWTAPLARDNRPLSIWK